MALEGSYEYECMRAELLGLERPNRDEFLKKEQERLEQQQKELEEAMIEETVNEQESMKNISGGLEELNSILSTTQKKINKFKATCGSLTNLLKLKVGHGSTDSLPKDEEAQGQHSNGVTKPNPINKEISIEISSPSTTERIVSEEKQNGSDQRKQDLAKSMDNSLSKLDSLINKAENAQYSMQHQNKQMKTFINK